MLGSGNQHNPQADDHWISATDLLGGALLIFFLLLLYFMISEQTKTQQHADQFKQTVEQLEDRLQQAQVKRDSVKEVAVLYDQKRTELYEQLQQEFAQDLPEWNAEIYQDLTIRFNEPNILFAVGSSTLRREFREILKDFFPRYLATIFQGGFDESVAELRIEGHTSSFWNRSNPLPTQEAYLNNMDLSSARSRSVLRFVTALPEVEEKLPWLRQNLTANGLSSSKLVLDENGVEDYRRSQRVEFRVRTNVESKILRTLGDAG